ncbi:hypothetical protein LCGC14_2534070, partial [marine sediment metagenome]
EIFTIGWDEFEIDTLDIQVELKADIPVDRQARINTAVQAYANLPLPAAEAMSGAGFTDTTLLMEQRVAEDFNNLAVKNTMQEMSREFIDALTQQIRAQVLQEFQQEEANAAQSRSNGAPGQAQGT